MSFDLLFTRYLFGRAPVQMRVMLVPEWSKIIRHGFMADMGCLGKPILGRWGRSPGIVQKAIILPALPAATAVLSFQQSLAAFQTITVEWFPAPETDRRNLWRLL
jgi:hypothetical protein